MRYLLFYEKAPDHATRSVPFQATHLAHVRAAAERGELSWPAISRCPTTVPA